MTTADHLATAAPPRLTIGIERVDVAEYAAVPTLLFAARIGSAATVRSVALTAQVRIAADRRSYQPQDQQRLVELFGRPDEQSRARQSLLWTHATAQVPGFTGETVVAMPVTCTYDFDVVAAKYLHSLRDGEVPLEFLFSGTLFYTVDGLLQVAQLPWDTEAEFRMPVRVWNELMERYFPHSAWLRLDRDTFDLLYGYRTRHTLPTWDDTVRMLLRAAEGG